MAEPTEGTLTAPRGPDPTSQVNLGNTGVPPAPSYSLSGSLGTDMNQTVPGTRKQYDPTSEFAAIEKQQGIQSQADADVALGTQKAALDKATALDKQASDIAARGHQSLEQYKANIQKIPAFVPTQDSAKDLAGLFSIMGVLGAGMSGSGHASAMGAMASMTGMMDGWKQGRQDLYQKEKDQYDKHVAAIKNVNETEFKELQEAHKLMATDMEAGKAAAELAAVKAGDKIMLDTIRSKDAETAMKLIQWKVGALEKMDEINAKQEELALKRLEAGGPQSQLQIAQAISSYQMPLPSGFALRSPFWQNVMSQVYQMNPEYSAAEYAKRNKAISAFGAGKQGDIVRSLNVASYHLGTLSDLAEALDNGDVQQFNRVGQAWSQQTGEAAPTNFDTAKQIVSTEILKAIGGTALGVTDRERLTQDFSRASSPEQLKGAITTAKQLLAGQLRGLADQYQRSTGLKFETSGLIDPDVMAIYGPMISGGTSGPKKLSEQDKEALDWANANSDDPRAAKIKSRLGQ